MSLLDALRGAGLTVKPYKYWETATNSGRDRTETVGIVNHWDAIKGEPSVTKYLYDNRFGGILYHLLIRRSGLVELLSQRYVWHAGLGSSQILDIARAGGPVPDDRAGPDDTNGNTRFFSVCINYHPDEGAIPQYDALVEVNRVLTRHFGLNAGQVFRHMDWTTRKRDIDTMNLDRFRTDIGDDMTPADFDKIREIVREEIRTQLVMDTASGPAHVPDEPNRPISYVMVNSALHAKSNGRKIYETLDATYDYAKQAAGDVADELGRRLTQ